MPSGRLHLPEATAKPDRTCLIVRASAKVVLAKSPPSTQIRSCMRNKLSVELNFLVAAFAAREILDFRSHVSQEPIRVFAAEQLIDRIVRNEID